MLLLGLFSVSTLLLLCFYLASTPLRPAYILHPFAVFLPYFFRVVFESFSRCISNRLLMERKWGSVVQSNKKDYLTVGLDSLVYAPFMEGNRCLEHFHATVDELGECFAFEQAACEERDVYELVHLLVLLSVCGIDALELVAQVC